MPSLKRKKTKTASGKFPDEMISGQLNYCNSPLDSCYTIEYKAQEIVRYDKSLGRLTAEVILAPAIGILSGFAFAGLGSAVIDAHGDAAWGLAILGLYTGYCVGTAGGVYVIAEGGNKELDSVWTIATGILGGVAAVSLVNEKSWYNDYSYIPLLALPLITSMIYANAIAPYPSKDQLDKDGQLITRSITLSLKDFYNSTILFNMEIARINF